MKPKEKNARIGEVKIGKGDERLRAILGSCVGVVLLWPNKGVYGLAHCLLSETPEKSFNICGRYVDHAITSLLKLMRANQGDYSEIRAVIAGGGNMTMPEETCPTKLVGANNVSTAIKCFKELKIKVINEDTGGMEGRTVVVHCATGEVEIKRIPRIVAG